MLLSPTNEAFPELVEHLTAQGSEVLLASNKNQVAMVSKPEDYEALLLAVDPMNLDNVAQLENWLMASPIVPVVLLCINADVDQLSYTLTYRADAIHSCLEDPRIIAASVHRCLDHQAKRPHTKTAQGDPHRDRLWKEISQASASTTKLNDPSALMQTVIDAIPEVTILVDREHRILLANRAANEISGGNPVDQGLSCHQLLHRRDEPCSGRDHPCSLKCVVAKKTPQTLTHKHYDRDGDEILVEVRAIPILDDTGEVVQMLESCRDITEYGRLQSRVSAAEKAIEDHLSASHALVGVSSAIKKVRRLIAQAAPTDFTVLILGESGVGKSLVARLIHEWSGRNGEGSFQVVNCPAIPEHLLESELFGYERGAFTNAVTRKPGRLEMAPGGTLFLDEIGIVPTSVQTKLLHVIEKKEFVRLGGHKTMTLNSRFVVATNADLKALARDGQFRSDLYYRLNQFPIDIPPLRERKEDIPVLAYHFLGCSRNEERSRTLPESIMERLLDYDWPGNVRELRSVMERYALTGELSGVGNDDPVKRLPNASDSQDGANETGQMEMRKPLSVTEKEAIHDALVSTRWNLRRASALLGIGYGALRYRIDKYGLKYE